MVRTRQQDPPAIIAPNVSNLYKLNYAFNDEKIIKADPFIDAITNYFLEADTLNKSIKALIAKRTKKKVPATPKKKAAATTLIREQIEELRKISFDIDDNESFNIPPIPSPPATHQRSPPPVHQPTPPLRYRKSPPLPIRTSPKKTITSQKRNAVVDAMYSPSPVQKKKAAAAAAQPSTPLRSHNAVVPKAAIVKDKDPNLEEKLRINAMKAKERRQKQMQEITEKLKRQNEEKERKIRERRAQMEEEARRKLEAVKNRDAKVREFEAKQREEATCRTPMKETKQKTPSKEKKLKPLHEKSVSKDLFNNDDDNQMGDVEDNDEPLNYVEITEEEEERENDIRRKTEKQQKQNHLAVGDGVENGEPLNYVEISDEDEILEESNVQSKTAKQIRAFSDGDIVQDSVTESMDTVVESMEEKEYENDENAPPLNQDINKSSYDMTAEKVYLPSTDTNYNVDDLSSNDETDDESKPRKTVPNWAKKHELTEHVKQMIKNTTTGEIIAYFGSIQIPDSQVLFNIPNNRRHRNSSAVWQSPLHQPTAGESRLPRR